MLHGWLLVLGAWCTVSTVSVLGSCIVEDERKYNRERKTGTKRDRRERKQSNIFNHHHY